MMRFVRTVAAMALGRPVPGLHLYRLVRPSGRVEAVVTTDGDRIPTDLYLEHLRERGYSERVAAAKLAALPELRRPA